MFQEVAESGEEGNNDKEGDKEKEKENATEEMEKAGEAKEGTLKLAVAPKHLFFAGCLIAFYLLSVTWIAPIIGLGNAIFLVLIGQLVAAALIDQFGLFGATQIQISWTRAAGLALMASGILLIQKA